MQTYSVLKTDLFVSLSNPIMYIKIILHTVKELLIVFMSIFKSIIFSYQQDFVRQSNLSVCNIKLYINTLNQNLSL